MDEHKKKKRKIGVGNEEAINKILGKIYCCSFHPKVAFSLSHPSWFRCYMRDIKKKENEALSLPKVNLKLKAF